MSGAQAQVYVAADERVGGRRRVGRKLPRSLVALVAAWLGAVLFFGAGVAPAAFAVLETEGDAGALVGRLLPVLFVAGFLVGGVLVAAAARLRSAASLIRRSLAIAGLVMMAACLLAQTWVAPELAQVREAAGRLEVRAPDDPLRQKFGRLHAMSVALLGVAWLGGAAMLLVGGLAPKHRS